MAYALREIVQYSTTTKMHTRAYSSCTRRETFSSLRYRVFVAYMHRVHVCIVSFAYLPMRGEHFFIYPCLESLTLRRNPRFFFDSTHRGRLVWWKITECPRDAKRARNKLLDIEYMWCMFKIFNTAWENIC